MTKRKKPAPTGPEVIRVTLAQIASDAGVTVKTARKHIAIAEKAGWLQVDRSDKRNPTFVLILPEGVRRA